MPAVVAAAARDPFEAELRPARQLRGRVAKRGRGRLPVGHTVEVTSDANASPASLPAPGRQPTRNMDQGDRSLGRLSRDRMGSEVASGACRPGRSVSQVARQWINASQLFTWCRQALAKGLVSHARSEPSASPAPTFAPSR